MERYYTLLDSEKGVGACKATDIPEQYKEQITTQGEELKNLTFYYDRECDMVVLNIENPCYEYYKDIVIGLLGNDDEEMSFIYKHLQEAGTLEKLKNCIMILWAVNKYRRREVEPAGLHTEL